MAWAGLAGMITLTGCIGVDEYGDLKVSRPRFGRNTTSVEGRVGPEENTVAAASRRTDNIVQITGQDIDFSGLIPRALVNIALTSNYRTQIMYRFSWYDARGVDITARSGGWRSVVLDGLGEATLTDQAPNADAVEFRVQLRRP